MIAAILKVLAGPIAARVLEAVSAFQGRKATEAEMRAEVEKAVLGALADISGKQANVILAEARGESRLQRIWRPCVAISFAAIVVFYGLILPIAVDWLGAPPVRIGDQLLGWIMQAVMICLGGYIGGRTAEKLAGILRSGKH